MDDFNIEEIRKIVLEEINNKSWGDLTFEELELIEDSKKRKEYLREMQSCVRNIINPLLVALNVKNHEITKNTCNGIIKEICTKRNITKKDIYDILGARKKDR